MENPHLLPVTSSLHNKWYSNGVPISASYIDREDFWFRRLILHHPWRQLRHSLPAFLSSGSSEPLHNGGFSALDEPSPVSLPWANTLVAWNASKEAPPRRENVRTASSAYVSKRGVWISKTEVKSFLCSYCCASHDVPRLLRPSLLCEGNSAPTDALVTA